MTPGTSVGRKIGILLLVQMASALVFPFVLIDALKTGYPDFLGTAAASSGSIRVGIALAFLGGALTLTLGVWMFPVLAAFRKRTALWFLAVCLISCALDFVHNGTVMSMLAVSEKFTGSAGSDGSLYQAWGIAAASMRRSAHIVQLLAIGVWMASFYTSLWRFRLVPRSLSSLAMAGVASQFTGVTLMMFLGYPPLGYLAMPLAPIHAATAIWLIVKGLPGADDEESAVGAS